MILKHLIEDLNSIIARANEYDQTTVDSVSYERGFVIFECGQEELVELENKLKDTEEVLTRYEEEAKQSVSANASLENRICELESELRNFTTDKEGTVLDLIARAANAETSERHYRATLVEFKRQFGEIQLENEKLRARKNKATVERCRITGKLVAEFDGVKYVLEQIHKVQP